VRLSVIVMLSATGPQALLSSLMCV
jgi:hypothetical protein